MASQSYSKYSEVPLQEFDGLEPVFEGDDGHPAGQQDRTAEQQQQLHLHHGAEDVRDWLWLWPAGIASLTIQIPESQKTTSKAGSSSSRHARWRSREFCIYYAIVVVALYKIIQAPIQLSRGRF